MWKTIWIGLTAVAVLAAGVFGVMLLRRGRVSQSTANIPGAASVPSTSNRSSGTSPSSPTVNVGLGTDPIVGCYQWFNNAAVVIRADGTMVGGPFTASWRLVSAAQRVYRFTWPEATDTVTISPDQRSLSGANQYGFPTSGTCIAGSSGLVGTWRWPNGVQVLVSP